MVDGLVRLAESDERFPVNLGNPVELTILEFADKIRILTGTRAETVHEALPSDDPRKRRPDISKARRLLGWEPKVTLEEGLRETIKYFRSTAQVADVVGQNR